MNFENVQIIVISLVSIANIVLLVWQSRKRMPGELDKMQAEKNESISEAAESIVAGAKDSNDLLLQRISELKRERRDHMNYIAVLKKQLPATPAGHQDVLALIDTVESDQAPTTGHG